MSFLLAASVFLLATGGEAKDEEAKLNVKDFAEGWRCPQNGSFLGNFPENFYYYRNNRGYRLSAMPDSWTTFPAVKAKLHVDDKKNVLSRSWKADRRIGFLLRPGAYGHENRLVVQFALDEKSPTEPSYQNVSQDDIRVWHPLDTTTELKNYESFSMMWELMTKGIFNCHINRYLSAMDVEGEDKTVRQMFLERQQRLADLKAWQGAGLCGNVKKSECRGILRKFDMDQSIGGRNKYYYFDADDAERRSMTCAIQTEYPLCCYAGWTDQRDSIKKKMGEGYKWGNRCREPIEPPGTPPIEDDSCKAELEKVDKLQRQDVYVKTQDPKCNTFFFATAESCKLSQWPGHLGVNARNRQTDRVDYTYPCVASCHTSLVLQVEITPFKNKAAEFHVTAAAKRYDRLVQPPYNLTVPRFFGYQVDPERHRTDYIGAKIANKFSGKKKFFKTDKYVGVWFQWSNRTKAGVGPILKIGEEGDAKPKMSVDMSLLDWSINGQPEPLGFKEGWKGVEMQRPLVYNTFKPYAVTINTVLKGQPWSYRSEGICPGKKFYPLHGGEKFSKTAIIAASCTLLGLALIVTGLVCYFGKNKPQAID